MIVVPPEIAWQIAVELPIMSRTLVLLAAATGLRYTHAQDEQKRKALEKFEARLVQ